MIRRWLRSATLLSFAIASPPTAVAYSTGIIGYSGSNRGIICNACHLGGTAPLVSFDGPTSAAPEALLTFHFVVQSQAAAQTFAGFNVAASGGSLQVVAGQGELRLGTELTHNAPKANDANGQAAFTFTWQAPATAGTYTLFGAGNSVRRDSNDKSGDQAAATTLTIEVGVAVTPTPPPTATATATATPPASSCVGDCSADGEVTVDELITGVNIALGTNALSACAVLDANGDGEVTIDALLQAVNAALNSCPM